MGKTGQQIEHDIFAILQQSPIAESISGDIYQQGMRPQNSALEDAVVTFVESLDGQIQQGSVDVNIYVPDAYVLDDDVLRKNIARCAQIEAQAADWVEALREARSEYLFLLGKSICTRQEETIHQHYIQVKLNFKLPSF